MKKYLFLLLILGLTVFVSCEDKGNDIPVPPSPPAVKPTEEGLLGTWETYYYEKQITVNPGASNQSSFPGLRYIDYDGFRSSFVKEDGEYKAKDYNLKGNLVSEASFHVKDDTIIYARTEKTKDDRDSIIYSWQRVREFNPEKGILTVDHSYTGRTVQDNALYKITDVKITRNTKTAPTTTTGVIPAKYMIDYDELCKGKWQIYLFKEYENGRLKENYSIEMTKELKNTTFDFYVNNKGNKRCIMTEWSKAENKLVSTDYPVLLIDDVIHLLYEEEIVDEDGETTYEDASIFLWVTSWEQRKDGDTYSDSFIDYKKSRYKENVRITVETQIYIKRIWE